MPVAVDGYEHYDAVSLGRRRHGLETVRRDGEEVAHEPRGLPPGFGDSTSRPPREDCVGRAAGTALIGLTEDATGFADTVLVERGASSGME